MRSSKQRSRSKPNRNRSVGNIVNRVFDSSGPEGKVRGTPQQIIDKYNQLARDAQLSNDRVATENFQQHAEHYTRMLSEAMREAEARREQQDAQQGGGQNANQNANNNQNNQNTGQGGGNQSGGNQGGGNQSGGGQPSRSGSGQGGGNDRDDRGERGPRNRVARADDGGEGDARKQPAPDAGHTKETGGSPQGMSAMVGETDADGTPETGLVDTPENKADAPPPPEKPKRKPRKPRAQKAADPADGNDGGGNDGGDGEEASGSKRPGDGPVRAAE